MSGYALATRVVLEATKQIRYFTNATVDSVDNVFLAATFHERSRKYLEVREAAVSQAIFNSSSVRLCGGHNYGSDPAQRQTADEVLPITAAIFARCGGDHNDKPPLRWTRAQRVPLPHLG